MHIYISILSHMDISCCAYICCYIYTSTYAYTHIYICVYIRICVVMPHQYIYYRYVMNSYTGYTFRKLCVGRRGGYIQLSNAYM